MKDFLEVITWLFEEVLFLPHQFLTSLELKNWWLANGVNFIFIAVGFTALVYWINQLKTFSDKGEENKDPSAHSFL